MPLVNIRISKESRIIYGWYIHPIPYEMSIKDFFIKLVNKEISSECNIAMTNFEEIERVELSKISTAIVTQVSPNCNIIELTRSVGEIHIHYRLKTDDIVSALVLHNSFTIMMQNAQRFQLYLPKFSQSERTNCKLELCNDLINWIQRHGKG
ncbi:hypothetical protein RclHR1_00070058 [Rhizophagus clarus]|uniref:Uncharacterized protein n=1 Tax=Rhizophagus clarus TaxID=94130 RepID=A0A2Z6RWJ4_9GLOM|nr:hypothetical protein RclHR1_00070058 [Rhizophagus clarus]